MAIYDFDDFDLKELNFDEPDSLDCRLDGIQFDDDLQLEFEDDEEDFFPIQNWDEGDEIDLLPKKKRIRTIFPCKK